VLDELWGRNELGQGTPCVEFADGAYRPLSPCAQAAALRYPDRFAFLQRITRRDPNLPALMAILASSPGCRSLRIVVHDKQERQLFATGGYDELLSLAQDSGLPISVLMPDAGAQLAGAAPRFPRLQFIIDHCGWIRNEQQWADVLALARLDNTCLKWSHAHRAFGAAGDPQENVQREFLRAVGAFGAQRMLWAGDVSHEESSATWAQLLAFVRDNPALSDDQKDQILSKTARRLFRWQAPVQDHQTGDSR